MTCSLRSILVVLITYAFANACLLYVKFRKKNNYGVGRLPNDKWNFELPKAPFSFFAGAKERADPMQMSGESRLLPNFGCKHWATTCDYAGRVLIYSLPL